MGLDMDKMEAILSENVDPVYKSVATKCRNRIQHICPTFLQDWQIFNRHGYWI